MNRRLLKLATSFTIPQVCAHFPHFGPGEIVALELRATPSLGRGMITRMCPRPAHEASFYRDTSKPVANRSYCRSKGRGLMRGVSNRRIRNGGEAGS